MRDPARLPYLRPATPADDGLLYDIFSTTWESEVAALPNQALARHVLRIQHIAQERRFDSQHAGLRRLVLTRDGIDVGRVYLVQTTVSVHIADVTVLPDFRGQGIGTRLLGDLMEQARLEGQTLTLRVPRVNERANALFAGLGFALVAVDDLDRCLEWTPTQPDRVRASRSPDR